MAGEGKKESGAKPQRKAEPAGALKAKPSKEELRDEEDLELEAEAEESEEREAREGEGPAKGKAKAASKGGAAEPKEDKKARGKARPKVKADAALKHALELRVAKNQQRQHFQRQEGFRYQRLGDKWRAPGGIQSKMRRHWGTHADVVSIGYRGPKAARGLHPSGFREVLIHNPDGLDGVDPAREAVRIASSVGKRKRVAIQKAAVKRGIRVLNWRQYA